MRLCVVGSIIVLILSMHVSMPAMQPVLMLLCGSIFLAYSIIYIRQSYHKKSDCISLLSHLKRACSVAVVGLLSLFYVQAWMNERLQSRLPASMTGVVVNGVADVVGCRLLNGYANRGQYFNAPEKLTLKIRSISPALSTVTSASNTAGALESAFPFIQKLILNYYPRSEKKIRLDLDDHQQRGCGWNFQSAQIKFKAKLRVPYSFMNPFGFDYEAWLLSEGVDATGYLKDFEIIGRSNSLQSSLQEIRQRGIEHAASFEGLSGQVLPALLFGEGHYLLLNYWQDLQATGTIHLLIVSGLHVGFLTMFALLFWRSLIRAEMWLLGNSYSYVLRLTPIFLLSVCLTYSLVSGMGVAVQRAGLMMAIGVIVVYSKRHWSPLDTWLWVIWMVLMLNPMVSLFVGFWFSFAAVGALLISYVGGVGGGRELWLKFISIIYRPQWIVFLALTPFLWIFQQPSSFLSIVINIIAIPLLAFVILPLSVVVYVSSNEQLLFLFNELLEICFLGLSDMADLTKWQVYKSFGIWSLCLIPIIIVALLPTGFPFRKISLLLVGVIFLLPVEIKQDQVLVMDVGQGLSVYGQSAGGKRNWLYDTGAKFRSGFSVGEAVAAKNIIGMTGNSLWQLFISHSDNDHAGGELGLKQKVLIRSTLAGQPRSDHHYNCHHQGGGWLSEEGYRWRVFNFDGVRSADFERDNNMSCVIQIEMSGVRILLPGDIEKTMEAALVDIYGKELKSDVLIVPHHGSKTSSSLGFIGAVDPQLAITSSGYANAFRHPHEQVLNLFQRLDIPFYNTATSGAVQLNLSDLAENNENIAASVVEWRKKNPPIWRQM